MNAEVLTWVFFGSHGVTDETDLIRANILCMVISGMDEPTVEKIKETSAYMSAQYDLPNHLLTDEKLQEMIDFKI